jgi:hypothetical protein
MHTQAAWCYSVFFSQYVSARMTDVPTSFPNLPRHESHPPSSFEHSKDFVRDVALVSGGQYALDDTSLKTVVLRYRDFLASWRPWRGDLISSSVMLAT